MWCKSEIVVSALLLSLSVASPALAKKPKPTPCPPDRYLLPSGISSLTGDPSTESVPLVLGTGQSSLGSCTLKSGKAKANKKGITTLVAKSPPGTTCNGFKKVLVRVTLQPGCQSATIKVRAKKFPLQTLQANRSFCGDGQIDAAAGEDCDGSGCPATATCDATCKCAPIPVTTTTTSVATTSTSPTTPTSITETTTTTTTTTTMIGVCLDANGHATAQQCGLNTDCPRNGTGFLPCCGNLVTDIGETCDRGSDNCAAGTLCESNCTSECKAIGRCTGGASGLISPPQACVLASDCGAGEGCCGNKLPDPPAETCDDGNFTDGPVPLGQQPDFCPMACFEPACIPVTTQTVSVSVTYTHAPGTVIAGLGLFVYYPEGNVTASTKGASVFGVSLDLNDLTYAFSVNALKQGGLPSPLAHVAFEPCSGAPAPTSGDFRCIVTAASDDAGNDVDASTLTCGVTVP